MSLHILCAGTWGITLAQLLANNGHDVNVWHYNPDLLDHLTTNRSHPSIPNVKLSSKINYNSNLQDCIQSNWIISAIPSQATRKVLSKIKGYNTSTIVVCVSKGIEAGSGKTMSQVIHETMNISTGNICILYGPTHAEEVMRKLPSAIVAASDNDKTAGKVQQLFSNSYFRVYRSNDVLGVELGGSIKNVIAIAAGICTGIGYGDNTLAALLTRGNHEISKLGEVMGADKNTFSGLSGIGDLIVTATSPHSRNRKVGIELGRGKSLTEILNEMDMIAEGVETTRALHKLAGNWGVELPICEQIYQVLFEQKNSKTAIAELMKRTLTRESV